ncbi:heme oxygenase-like protein [Pholiota conissans]|uniref:Heme oxygenase-like protein n=1 Tax=Pholiota conissans TaxID=109636 RepID=A0A9P5YZI8_9AGAR|nr:heme oxygenase-like protein [Pholiota conissans]
MGSPPLSEHLISLDTFPSYKDATRHTFLAQAGDGTLPLSRLALWLSQDRIYAAHAYPRFIGSLLSRIPFQDSDNPSGPKERQNEEILRVLVSCLDNIVREVQFFKDTTEQFGLNVEEWAQRKATRDYTAEMVRVASSGSLEDGIIFLWAMERVYLDAWRYVKSIQKQSANPTDSNASNNVAAVRSLAENWSSPEFELFVDTLQRLVDGLEIKPWSEAWFRAEDIWSRVLELEVAFWPEDGEELVKPLKKQLWSGLMTQTKPT